MSFSTDVKTEISENISQSLHCKLSELAAMISMTAHIGKCNDEIYLKIENENEYVIQKIIKLLKILYDFNVLDNDKLKIIITNQELISRMLTSLKLNINDDGFIVQPIIVERNCCKRTFFRGAFLVAGSINNPEKAYHLEIVCNNSNKAEFLLNIIKSFNIDAKIVARKKYFVLYIKEGSMIVDVLNIIEAHNSLMNLENVRIIKDMRNTVNRRVNCETANINKTVSAAIKQIEDIQYIETTKGLKYLNSSLRQLAVKRLEAPEMPLKELGELLTPPISKSGVNHRLRKISEIAKSLRENEHSQLGGF